MTNNINMAGIYKYVFYEVDKTCPDDGYKIIYLPIIGESGITLQVPHDSTYLMISPEHYLSIMHAKSVYTHKISDNDYKRAVSDILKRNASRGVLAVIAELDAFFAATLKDIEYIYDKIQTGIYPASVIKHHVNMWCKIDWDFMQTEKRKSIKDSMLAQKYDAGTHEVLAGTRAKLHNLNVKSKTNSLLGVPKTNLTMDDFEL